MLMPHVKSKNIWALAVAALGLASCASLPDLGTTRNPKPLTAYAADQSFTAPAGEWPSDGWWNAYGDSQLTSLIDAALQGSPSMAQAQSPRHEVGSRGRRGAIARLPTLEGDGSYAEVKQSLNQGFPPQFAQYLPRGYTPRLFGVEVWL